MITPDAPARPGAVLALYQDKSPRPRSCPQPRLNRAFLDVETGELHPIPCGRNTCTYCRPRNVQITAAMMGLNAAASSEPPTVALLSTTRDWVDDSTLREGWRQVARRARKEIDSDTKCAWFREWTTGRNDGVRRTHYHSIWNRLTLDQGHDLAAVSRDVWGRIAGAHSEKAHGAKEVWNAGGLARYVAGLAGHHLKSGQAPPPGWNGRRYGTSRGFYAIDPAALRKEATAAVRDERLAHALMLAIVNGSSDSLPVDIVDDLLTARLAEARARPKPRIVRVAPGTWGS